MGRFIPAQKRERKKIGFGFLATCRQAYTEGYVIFYTKNTFLLPPGRLPHTFHWAGILRPEHTRLIRSLGLSIGCSDLKHGGFIDKLASGEYRSLGYIVGPLYVDLGVTNRQHTKPERLSPQDIGSMARFFLEKMWLEKLYWIDQFSWDSVHELVVENDMNKVTFEGQTYKTGHDDVDDVDDSVFRILPTFNTKLNALLASALDSVQAKIAEKVQVLGFEGTKAWVEAESPHGVFGGTSL